MFCRHWSIERRNVFLKSRFASTSKSELLGFGLSFWCDCCGTCWIIAKYEQESSCFGEFLDIKIKTWKLISRILSQRDSSVHCIRPLNYISWVTVIIREMIPSGVNRFSLFEWNAVFIIGFIAKHAIAYTQRMKNLWITATNYLNLVNVLVNLEQQAIRLLSCDV